MVYKKSKRQDVLQHNYIVHIFVLGWPPDIFHATGARAGNLLLELARQRCSYFYEVLRRRAPLLFVWAFYGMLFGAMPYFFGSELLGVCS